MKAKTFLTLCLVFIFCLTFTGCPDANNLHNQMAAKVVVVFQNFPEDVDGEYAVPGHFCGAGDSWEVDVSNTCVKMSKGNGTSDPITCSNANIQFSLVKTGDTAWNRGWYKAGIREGNGVDGSNGKMTNFYIDGLDLSKGEITLIVDGSENPVTPVEK